MKRIQVIMAIVLFVVCGCHHRQQQQPQASTPITPKLERFEVRSVPTGAYVSFSTKEKCETPCVLMKSLERDFTVTLSKEGYKAATRRVRITGDAAYGLHLSPNPINVPLEPAWEKE